MSGKRDPVRWLDQESDASAAWRTLLRAGAQELPDPTRLEAMASRLVLAAEAEADDGIGTSNPTHMRWPWGGATAVALLVAAGAWWMLRPETEARRATGTTNAAEEPPEEQSGMSAGAGEPEATAKAAPQAATVSETETRNEAVVDAPSAARPRVAGTRARGQRDHQSRRVMPPKPPAADPSAELALIDRAQRALGHEPRRALAETRLHLMRFPEGQFAQERELIAIEALLALRRPDDARRRGTRFLTRYADSGHARKVRKLLSSASK